MQRWRLRFNLQELDLQQGRIALGRAAECPITFEDPLVSRHHAEIVVTRTGATVHDLGSRNGVRINGVRITGPTALRPNDRIRLGRDELVILMTDDRIEDSGYSARPTGIEDVCQRCGHEHAAGVVSCPGCGGTLPGVSSLARPPVAEKPSAA
jgi:hypothetical protein